MNHTQISLLTKGKKLREILLDQSSDDASILLGSKIIDVLAEITTIPINISDEKSAKERIYQWKKHELLCERFQLTAESYNLIHFVSLVKVYEDLMKVGEKIVEKNRSIKNWVIKFMKKALGINRRMEYRNRLGCDRLRSLFKQGITSEHLVKAGCYKSDFLVSKEDYAIFLSQIPPTEERSILVLPTLSELVPDIDLNEFTNNSKKLCYNKDTRRVKFKLRVDDDDLRKMVDNEDIIYIE